MAFTLLQTNIHLNQLTTEASIGVYPHEQSKKQPLIIDAEITIQAHSFASDTLNATLDYDELQNLILSITQSQHFNLLEFLCQTLIDAILNHDKRVEMVRIKACKPSIKAKCQSIAVECVGTRA